MTVGRHARFFSASLVRSLAPGGPPPPLALPLRYTRLLHLTPSSSASEPAAPPLPTPSSARPLGLGRTRRRLVPVPALRASLPLLRASLLHRAGVPPPRVSRLPRPSGTRDHARLDHDPAARARRPTRKVDQDPAVRWITIEPPLKQPPQSAVAMTSPPIAKTVRATRSRDAPSWPLVITSLSASGGSPHLSLSRSNHQKTCPRNDTGSTTRCAIHLG